MASPEVLRSQIRQRQPATERPNMPDHINDPGMPIHTAPFSTLVRDNNYVFLSGLVATDMEGGQAVVGDIAKETHLVMTMIKRLLASIGLNMEDIVRVDVHLTDLNDMDAMNVIYGAFFAEGKKPARTTTQSAKLAGGSSVEVTCMAQIRED
jgi:2-iminobutanoate/2-iminopropanoate deaminase